jgi:hypothetical protein
MMSDIVAELRGMKWMIADEMRGMVDCDLPQRAANEIERLRIRTFTKADVEAAARSMVIRDAFDWDAVCEQDDDNDCHNDKCVASHQEDHDPDLCKSHYLALAHAALSALGEVEG